MQGQRYDTHNCITTIKACTSTCKRNHQKRSPTINASRKSLQPLTRNAFPSRKAPSLRLAVKMRCFQPLPFGPPTNSMMQHAMGWEEGGIGHTYTGGKRREGRSTYTPCMQEARKGAHILTVKQEARKGAHVYSIQGN